MPCYVVTVADSSRLLTHYLKPDTQLSRYAPKNYLHNVQVADIVYQLNLVSVDLPVVDETGSHRFFDLDLQIKPSSLFQWEVELKTIGLQLTKTHRTLSMFVLSDDDQP